MAEITPAPSSTLIKDLADIYVQCFTSYAGKIVLRDLQSMYYDKLFFSLEGDKPVDLSRLGALEGQRQVVMRILKMMQLSEQLKAGESVVQSATQTHAETDMPPTLKGDE